MFENLNETVLALCLYGCICCCGKQIQIKGSRLYPVQNQPFTFTCTFDSIIVATRQLWKDGNRFRVLQLANDGSDVCYNVTGLPVVCEPAFCSCSQKGGTFTAKWTLGSVNDAISRWKCVEVADQSVELILRIAIQVASIRLEGDSGISVPAIADQTKSLTCISGESRPSAYIEWFIGDNNYTSNSTSVIIVSQEEKTRVRSVMTFIPRRNMTNLFLNCKAYNIDPSVMAELPTIPRLDVQYGPRVPFIFNPPFSTYLVNESQELGPIKCSTDCNPECSYTWTYEHQTVVNNNATLVLQNIQRTQAGTYQCTARNSIGSNKSSDITVNVYHAAVVTNMKITGYNNKLLEGSSPIITCEAEGFPMPEISLINMNADRIIASTNSSFKLEYRFPLVKCEDAGLYRCEAENKFPPKPGLEHYVYVVCSPRIVLPANGETFLGINENVTLTTIFVAHPRPLISWYFQTNLDISEVKIKNGIHIYSAGAYHTTYLIKTLGSNKDFGIYTVKAFNSIGTVNSTFSLKIKEQANSQSSRYQTGVILIVIGSILAVTGVCVLSVSFLAKLRKRSVSKKRKSESAYCDLEDKRKQANVYDTCQNAESDSDAKRSSEPTYENPRSEQNYENPSFIS